MPKSSNENLTPISFNAFMVAMVSSMSLQQQAFGQLQLEQLRVDGMALHDSSHLRHEIGLVELLGTHVHRQRQVAGKFILLPCLELGAGRLQHPMTDGQYQPGFFRQRNELSR